MKIKVSPKKPNTLENALKQAKQHNTKLTKVIEELIKDIETFESDINPKEIEYSGLVSEDTSKLLKELFPNKHKFEWGA